MFRVVGQEEKDPNLLPNLHPLICRKREGIFPPYQSPYELGHRNVYVITPLGHRREEVFPGEEII